MGISRHSDGSPSRNKFLRWILITLFILSTLYPPVLLAKLLTEQQYKRLIAPDDILAPLQQGQETVRVIINLAPPPAATQATNWNSPVSLKALHSDILARQQQVLSALPGNEYKLRYRFQNQAAFSAEVTPAALQKLSSHPRVESIEPVYLLHEHLAQGISLINASTYRPTYNGSRVAIAVCDTGIDYNHQNLGGGGFPNPKVIGGYDFGDDDSNPVPNGHAHGTCCAGIAAGEPGNFGDYIGGVAFNAKLYALKISYGTSGSAYEDAMIAAWDWCVSHKNDDPCNPILVITTSFGGGRYSNPCDSSSPAMTAAANNAVAAGITVLASAGNDGYCDSMGWPACISNVISVGAVYDAAFGDYYPCVSKQSCAIKYQTSGCSTGYYAIDATESDIVTSYSNTAAFLNLFAPANRAYTTDIVGPQGYSSGDYYSSFGGTSAACPYVAGAVAALQSAAKEILGRYLDPDEVRDKLTATGDPVTDTKVSITKPRINLGRAIAGLTGLPPTALDDTISITVGTQRTITLQANDDGVPNPPAMLTFIITSLPQHATLTDPKADHVLTADLPYTLAGNGNQVIYTPTSQCYVGVDSFSFKANDGGVPPYAGDSNTATVTIDVSPARAVIYETDFQNGLPDGWTIDDGYSDGYTWTPENPAGRSNSNWQGTFMIVDSDWAGRKTSMDEQLITQSFDCSNLSDVTLQFDHCFSYYSLGLDEKADVDISINHQPWQNIARYEQKNYEGRIELNLSQIADGQTDVRIRWHYYNAKWEWYWGIDNVSLIAAGVLPSTAGDFEPDCDVDIYDFAVFASAWLSKPGDENWKPNCDISDPNDNVIDERDLAVFSQNWLTCY